MSNSELLQRGVDTLGINLDIDTQQKLLAYIVMLKKWNTVYNLTAIRDPQQMVSNHLLDSLAILPYLWAGRWLDVGSGAGLPGIVMAITRPDWQVEMLDSNSKKTSFVQQSIIELGLQNASVHCARVEDWKTKCKFDGIVSRAFTELGNFVSLSQHLIADGGRWAAMKGMPEGELAGMPANCEVDRIIPLQVPGLHAARSLVIASCTGSRET